MQKNDELIFDLIGKVYFDKHTSISERDEIYNDYLEILEECEKILIIYS